MRIDIVIVNYNSTVYLLDCLRSIYHAMAAKDDFQIFIFDNASTDQVHRIKKRFPDVYLMRSRFNIGFSKAVNRAIQLGTAPYVLILNPDTYLQKPFFGEIISFMEANPTVGILGPRIFDAHGQVQGSARRFPKAGTALFGRNTILTRLFPNNRYTAKHILSGESRSLTPIDVDWISGACMMVRRKAIETVGLLDENFFMYWEDADWCQRMRQENWRVVYFPESTLVHYTGVSSRKNYLQTSLEFHRSAYYLFCKSAGHSNRVLFKGVVFFGLLLRAYVMIFMKIFAGLRKGG